MEISIFTLITIGNVIAGFTQAMMIIFIIITTLWLSEKILYKTGVDLLKLWRRFKKTKRMRDWYIFEG